VAREGSDDAAELDRRSEAPGQVRGGGDPSTAIEVFTTRIDTIFGATSFCSARSTRWCHDCAERSPDPATFQEAGQAFRLQDPCGAHQREVEKQGFDTGVSSHQPVHGQPVPVWVANFVLGEYGTGA
jgi:leucyl-tRNA synthetase